MGASGNPGGSPDGVVDLPARPVGDAARRGRHYGAVGKVKVGTASWTDKSLLASGWYPPEVETPGDRLAYYAGHFPLVEVDSTYYGLPSERNAVLWTQRTPPGFTFNVKAFSLLTGHPTRVAALPKELRPDDAGRANVYAERLAPEVVDGVWDRFLSALAPLHEAGRLGLLLFQFPPWFSISKANKARILDAARRAQPYRICVEFRHASWMAEENRDETVEFLEGYGLPYVSVDMPQGFRSSLPPVAVATADVAVVRFHGRNAAEWESGSVHRRFAYLYRPAELQEWVPRIRDLADQTEETHVLMNNCYEDYAQRNAADLARLLQRD